MGSLLKYCSDCVRVVLASGLMMLGVTVSAQGNCLIYPEGSGEREACNMSYRAISYPQGSRESQMVFDSAIAVGPNYAYAYYQKAVPYLKRGLLTEGISLLNRAIELEPLMYLTYRGYWYYAHASYRACIQDLESYYALDNAYMQETPGGDINMRMMLATAYAEDGRLQDGLRIAQDYLAETDEAGQRWIDHYILGVLYYKSGLLDESMAAFNASLDSGLEFYGNHYYLAKVYLDNKSSASAHQMMVRALSAYESSRTSGPRNSMYFPISEKVLMELESKVGRF